ncbi:class I SAM-dependent methyltransferase [Spongiibacter sp. KMU-158]|uniref:Class I SAM-dependent methyltransferase n=1 Tax=Spongiibacter pelagi TaxID=2760804 RepID=A0A927GWM0_9GAMM|nr:methyltransferase domain-containing protein [Spongiibacter pelagi]MBD2859891.1 class I SAM-dependent methyltransferase [Spongiibacter pelagi]
MSQWRSQHAPDALLPALRQWFTTPLGRTVLNDELPLINQAVSDYRGPGRHLLKLSAIPERVPLNSLPGHTRQFHLGSLNQYGYSQVLDAIGDFHQLPVANESQDIVLLHHLIEFVENPHRVLREVERVITPHGKLVVCVINPYSLLACRSILGRFKRSPMWQNHMLSIGRIQDWLSLLGFELDGVSYGFHRLPVNRPTFFLDHKCASSKLPMGGVYVLTATKYRAPLTPSMDAQQVRSNVLRHPVLGATRNWKPVPKN